MPLIHIVTVSDRAHTGRAPDTAGPRALELLADLLPDSRTENSLVPDGVDSVRGAVQAAREAGADVVLTLGGTGVSPRDLTPEAMDGVIETELPGVAELLRREGAAQTPTAALSRGRAGIIGRRAPADDGSGSVVHGQPTVVVNLPGSLRAVEQGIRLLAPLLDHLMNQLKGGDHDRH
ncbi:molybdenum cofactor biosynthesis protein B [Citricoccus sp. GCM10030269]|uniref:MogA/MoaB family molybdenum cofactor biosynthesis protein n=1 Tax=Citricoccus sp. GCM10030269 TaxID=3273388 RepID=UPI00362323A5